MTIAPEVQPARAAGIVGAVRDVLGDLGKLRVDLAVGNEVRLHAAVGGDPLQRAVLRCVGGGAVEDVDHGVGRLGGDREKHRGARGDGLVVARRDAGDVGAGGAGEPRAGRVLDRDRLAEPEADVSARIGLHSAADGGREPDGRAGVALEHDPRERVERALGAALDFVEPHVALLVGQVRHLEGRVPLESAARVVVDRLAGP